MQWMEIIKVQTAGREAREHCRDSLAAFKGIHSVPDLVEIRHLDNATIDGWHILLLDWDSAYPELPGSRVGQTLIDELKRFGMVDHSVWTAPESKPKHTGEP